MILVGNAARLQQAVGAIFLGTCMGAIRVGDVEVRLRAIAREPEVGVIQHGYQLSSRDAIALGLEHPLEARPDLRDDGHLRARIERARQRQRLRQIARLHGRGAYGNAARRFNCGRFCLGSRAGGGAHRNGQCEDEKMSACVCLHRRDLYSFCVVRFSLLRLLYSSGSLPITKRSEARAFAWIYMRLIADVLGLPQRLLRVDHVELRRRAELVIRFGHLARSPRLRDIQLGRLNRAVRQRERVERRLHFQTNLTFERGNLLRHGVALRNRLRHAAVRALAVEERHLEIDPCGPAREVQTEEIPGPAHGKPVGTIELDARFHVSGGDIDEQALHALLRAQQLQLGPRGERFFDRGIEFGRERHDRERVGRHDRRQSSAAPSPCSAAPARRTRRSRRAALRRARSRDRLRRAALRARSPRLRRADCARSRRASASTARSCE